MKARSLSFCCCFCFLPYVYGIFRLTRTELPRYHYVVQNAEEKYFISARDSLILLQISDYKPSWLKPSECVSQSRGDQTLYLNCMTVAKLKIGIDHMSCPTCNRPVMTIRVSENPTCYYWHARELSDKQSFAHLQVFVVPLQHAVSFGDSSLAIITSIFHSRGEQPQFRTLLGEKFATETVTYNETSKLWSVLLSKEELQISPYVEIFTHKQTPVFGCSISNTVVYTNQLIINPFKQVFLDIFEPLPVSNLVGKVKFHPCSPERAVLVTTFNLYFTKDDFVTYSQIHLLNEFFTFGANKFSDFAVSVNTIFIIVDGGIFGTKLKEGNLLFKGVDVQPSESILGIATFPVCLRSFQISRYFAWESGYVVAWSKSKIFLINDITQNISHVESWRKMMLPQEYSGALIVKAKFAVNPNYLWVYVEHKSYMKLLECSYTYSVYPSCSELTLLSEHVQDMEDWHFLSAAHSSVIFWSNSQMRYSYDHDERKGVFLVVRSVRNVAFNADNTAWFVQNTNNILFYGNGKCKTLLRLRRVDKRDATEFTYKFRVVDNELIRISWGKFGLTTEVYLLHSEIYSKMHENHNHTLLCDFTYYISRVYLNGSNVINLESVDQEIVLNFTIIHPAVNDVDISLHTNFIDLITLLRTERTLKTYSVPGRPLMRVQSIQTILTGTCMAKGFLCNRGIALFEIEVRNTDGQATCMLPLSQVIFINVTCLVGLNVRITSESFHESYNSVSKPSDWPAEETGCRRTDLGIPECKYTLSYPYGFYPVVELYLFNKKLYEVTDDVEFIEIHNRTGIEMLNKNLVLKDCYLCAKFHPRYSSSNLTLQTARSSCPCKLEKYAPDRWIGNISLQSIGDPDGDSKVNLVAFNVTILGKSHCYLTAKLLISVVPVPTVEFYVWEAHVVWIFALCTLVVLTFTYWNYRIYYRADLKMKTEKSK